MMMKKTAALLVPLALGLACAKKEAPPTPPPMTVPATTLAVPVSVASVTLGKAIGADKTVSAPAESFAPKDTIYASVATAGTGHAKLRALWSFVRGAKTAKVDETTIEVEATGPTVNEFHVSKPSGWPKGDYKVDIFLGEEVAPAATKVFKVS